MIIYLIIPIVFACLPDDTKWSITDQDALQLVKNQNKSYDVNCLVNLMQHGYFQTATYLYEEYFIKNNQHTNQTIQNTIVSIKKNLEMFHQLYTKATTQIQLQEPIFQWIQSNTTILFQVKFSHRFDAPACLNTKIDSVVITNESVLLSAKGVLSHQPIHYLLNLTLFNTINSEESSWVQESVGTMVFNLTKQNPLLWRQITKEKRKLNIWWEMKHLYRRHMDEFLQMFEEDDKEVQTKKKKKQKRKDDL